MELAAKPLVPARYAIGRWVRELQQFVRIPSVSSDPKRSVDVRRCAIWLAGQMRKAGLMRVRVLPTARHPIVYGERLGNPGNPTVLIYGHYDVQPAEPVKDWKLPPFSAAIHNGFLHGRGASDDKGQLFAHVKAIETLCRTRGQLPVNIKCLFEGEEEIGSTNLLSFLSRNRRALSADAVVMSDTPMLTPDQPALAYSLRGQLALELEVHGQTHDLHSGNFGGAVHDPLQALCEIVARLHDRNGRIAIPGFYARVRRPSEAEREYFAHNGPSDSEILRQTGARVGWGERDYSLYERLSMRPSLAVTGLRGGHIGVGPKGVIPSVATVKLSFRLVPDQDPAEVEKLLRRYIAHLAPGTVRVVVCTHIRSRPATIDRGHPAMQAAAVAYRRVFGRAPIWLRVGGTISVVNDLQSIFGIPIVLMGFGSPEDNLHGPNERFSLRNFSRAILTSMAFLEEFGRTEANPAADARNRTTREVFTS